MARATRRSKKTVIQVPIDYELLANLDAAVGRVAESRAAFIRDACRLRLEMLAKEERDQQYEAAYRKQPEDPAWARLSARILAAKLARDRW
jgi:metal-responsive CopG/Arc/MetJ family transcriptional regulator